MIQHYSSYSKYLIFLITLVIANEYCDIDPGHLLCIDSGPRELCTQYGIIKRKFSKEEQTSIMETFNNYRSQVANGLESDYNLPSASNMRELVWSDELARIAQARADHCNVDLFCAACDDGQNLKTASNLHFFKSFYSKNPNRTMDFYDIMIKMPKLQVKSFPEELIKYYQYNFQRDPYAYIIWGVLHSIGCGINILSNDTQYFNNNFLYCVHGPRAAVPKEEVYKIGSACSNCPSGTECSKTYDGLCAIPKEIIEVTEEPITTTYEEITTTVIDPTLTPTEQSTSTEKEPTISSTEQTSTIGFVIDITTPNWDTLITTNYSSSTTTTTSTTKRPETSTDLVISSANNFIGVSFKTVLLYSLTALMV